MAQNRLVLVRIWFVAISGLGVGALATSCSSPAPVEGTNTNWIKCVKDADCANAGAAASCSDGYCVAKDGGARIVTQASTLPACSWPPEFDGDASSLATCHAARAELSCGVSGGSGASCSSNDDRGPCPIAPDIVPCVDVCPPDEYGLTCGGVGGGPKPAPPAACRNVLLNPGGLMIYCCPCGS